MKQLILILTVIFTVFFAQAQKTTINGKVIDKNAMALNAATISLLNHKDSVLIKSVLSDSAGNFLIENKGEGKFLISASATGCQTTYSTLFSMQENKISFIKLTLLPLNKTLDNVSVITKKAFIEHKLDKTVINVEASITSAGSTAMEVLEKSPGVSVDKDGKISLKGKQGVVVLIDGKQTYMGFQDLANYLQSMPAANLEQIELMPNPSAKYDASGNSGIINIKIKRNKQKGFNGSVKNTLAVGKYLRTFNTVNLNYKNGKCNVFSTFGVDQRKSFQELVINRKYYDASSKLYAIFDQTATFKRNNNNNNAKIGVDYYATKKTSFGIVFTASISPSTQNSKNISYLKNANAITNSILNSNATDEEKWKNTSINLNLRHVFDSTVTELTVDVDALQYKSLHDQNFQSENYTPSWVKQSSEKLISTLPAIINVYSAKIDYVHPFKSGLKLETGIKTSFVNTDNVADYFNVVDRATVIDNDKTNRFKYKENINAAYLNFTKEFKKWSLQTGLRFENTNYKGTQFGNPVKPDSAFNKSYTGLFPTMFAGYKLNDRNQFGFSYGRRISRPDYESLNPFIFFIDKYTYEAGNPFLKPMYANVFELSHTYNKFLTSNLNYTHSKDMFNEYFEQSGYATIVKQNNYGSIDDVSFSLNAALKPAKWWTMMTYAELNYNKVNSQLYGFILNTSGTGFSSNLNNQFTFKKGWGAELSGFYRSKMKRGQFEIGSMKQISTGISKQILKNKGNLKLNVADIFNSGRQKGIVNIQNTVAAFTQTRDNRNVGITFSYRFGNALKIQQRKSGGAGDEQSRIKTN